MKKILWIVITVLFLAFIAIQFFRPEKNNAEITDSHILKQETIPQDVQVVLKNACLDCHSNTTNYLWFHHIQPVAWLINDHIKEGKNELNLSHWGGMDAFKKMDVLDEMCQEVEEGTMPLQSYRLIHSKANLSDGEIDLLCKWSENLIEKLMAEQQNK
ncbi:MAG: heme-binding domain-containing protein [Prolixibacteraceae bacterium]